MTPHSLSGRRPSMRGIAPSGRIGVRAFLFIVLSVCAVLPVTLLGIDQARRWARSEIEATDRQAEAAARTVAEEVSTAMLEYVHATSSLAAQMVVRGTFDRATAFSVLTAYTAFHPELHGAYLTDMQGASLANQAFGQPPIEGTIVYADRDYFRDAKRMRRPAISKVQLGRFTHELALHIAAPMIDSRQTFWGVACSSIKLESIAEQARESARGMLGGRVVLIDSDGQKIADSNPEHLPALEVVAPVPLFAAVQPEQAELRVGLDERRGLVRAVAVGLKAPVAGWRAVAMVPQGRVDQKARQVAYQTAFISMVVVLATMGVAAWASGWIARPLRTLAAAAYRVSRGALDVVPAVRRGAPWEMMQLTFAVRSMVESLRSYSADLESQVAARTQELSLANEELSLALATNREKDERIREDIAQARLFQEKMLPSALHFLALDIAVAYQPLEQVGGDIYDIVEVRPGLVRVFLVDATGHGLQAAMRTILLKSTYDRIKFASRTPTEVLASLNAYLVSEFPEGDMHCTASCIDLGLGDRQVGVSYANAGNSAVLIFSGDGSMREVYADGPLLGVDRVDWPEEERFVLDAGQCLLVSSDGMAEQRNPYRERFEAFLARQELPWVSAASLIQSLVASFDEFRETEPVGDDLTLIALLFCGRGGGSAGE